MGEKKRKKEENWNRKFSSNLRSLTLWSYRVKVKAREHLLERQDANARSDGTARMKGGASNGQPAARISILARLAGLTSCHRSRKSPTIQSYC